MSDPSNQIHAPPAELHSLSTPWPFHTWPSDLTGPTNPPSRGYLWMLLQYNGTKCIEAVALKGSTGATAINFIHGNVL